MGHDDLNEIERVVGKIVRMLVDDPTQVQVSQSVESHRHVVVTVEVPASQRRFVIGGSGLTIDAIERLMKAIAGKHRHSVELNFYNPPQETAVYRRPRRRR